MKALGELTQVVAGNFAESRCMTSGLHSSHRVGVGTCQVPNGAARIMNVPDVLLHYQQHSKHTHVPNCTVQHAW